MHVAGPFSLPTWWQFVLLTLAVGRTVRLMGWDEFPLAVKVRAWVTGEHWVPAEVDETTEKAAGRIDAAQLGLPGKQPTSQVAEVRPAYRRPTLSHLIRCPFCLGAWASFAAYGAWLAWPRGTMYAAVPLALSYAVGLVAKDLDA